MASTNFGVSRGVVAWLVTIDSFHLTLARTYDKSSELAIDVGSPL
jgi:hypothetical protein